MKSKISLPELNPIATMGRKLFSALLTAMFIVMTIIVSGGVVGTKSISNIKHEYSNLVESEKKLNSNFMRFSSRWNNQKKEDLNG